MVRVLEEGSRAGFGGSNSGASIGPEADTSIINPAAICRKDLHDLSSVEPLHAGVFMVVQRFRGNLGLYVHLHALATDGAFEEAPSGKRSPTSTPPTFTGTLPACPRTIRALDTAVR